MVNYESLILSMVRDCNKFTYNNKEYHTLSVVMAWENGFLTPNVERQMFSFLVENGLLQQLGDRFIKRAKELGLIVLE